MLVESSCSLIGFSNVYIMADESRVEHAMCGQGRGEYSVALR